MEKLIPFGRVFFAIAFIGPGIQHFIFGEFITLGRVCLGNFLLITGIQHFMFTEFVASLIPAWFPGDAVFWTWFGGIALIAGGLGLLISKTARLAALLSGLMVFFWFWIIHIPRAFVSESDGISVFEALAVSGIAFVIAGFLNIKKNYRSIAQSPHLTPNPELQ